MTTPWQRGLLVVPASNTTMAPEMDALCPAFAPFAVARVRRAGGMLTRDDLPEYLDATLRAVEPFLADRPHLVVHGCTAAGFLDGLDGNAKVVEALRRQTGATVVSTAASMIDVLRHDAVRETAVVTPYRDAVNDGLRACLAGSGITVEGLATFNCADTDALGRISEEQVRELALATVTARSRALFIACSQLPTLRIVPELRQRLGIPVWSSIRATAWATLRAMAVAPV
jgi:maleate cis-trans isomerase